jgi:hypothetical protein
MHASAANHRDASEPGPSVKTIVLELARNPGVDTGVTKRAQGYVITAPLDDDGRLTQSGVKPRRWPVRRFGDVGDGETGWLAHRGKAWFIDYDEDTVRDDEAIFRLSDHRFLVGEYLTITGNDRRALTYRVAEVEPLS